MSESDSKDPKDQKPKEQAVREKTSGRVAFDARGNAVWEWQMSTGVYGRDVDTKRLKKLEAKDLRISDDPSPAPSAAATTQSNTGGKSAKSIKGFNPYDSAKPVGKSAAPRSAAPPADKAIEKPDTSTTAKTKSPSRLRDWLRFRKSED